MNFHTICLLAQEFGVDFSRAYCETRWPGFPPEANLQEASTRLRLLSERIGKRNFDRVARVWSSWLIEGIDK